MRKRGKQFKRLVDPLAFNDAISKQLPLVRAKVVNLAITYRDAFDRLCKGMGIKTTDAMLFACCPTHRAELDANNKLQKKERRALENELCVKTHAYLIENNLLRIA
jgi:hypothetical protein